MASLPLGEPSLRRGRVLESVLASAGRDEGAARYAKRPSRARALASGSVPPAMKNHRPDIAAFLEQGSFAVVGASQDRAKYGNKCLRCYQQHGLPVVAVNPKAVDVEGSKGYASLALVPDTVRASSVVAPPAAAMGIVKDAIARGIRHLWFQPGAEEASASVAARSAGIHVIDDGACVLVALGFRDE